jgi:hypothetical protein
MQPPALYRGASGLLLLFAIGHTLGFQQADPAWGVDAVLRSMQSSPFTIQGFTRTYWDFFLGAGFTVGVLYVFAAVLAWQLGGLPAATLASMRATTWSFAACFVAVTALSWRYLFWIPIVTSALISACLAVAAWRSHSAVERGAV